MSLGVTLINCLKGRKFHAYDFIKKLLELVDTQLLHKLLNSTVAA
jgi:hypothetical protein